MVSEPTIFRFLLLKLSKTPKKSPYYSVYQKKGNPTLKSLKRPAKRKCMRADYAQSKANLIKNLINVLLYPQNAHVKKYF